MSNASETQIRPDLVLFRYADLLARGIVRNRMTLRRWIEGKGFPRPIRLGANSAAWRVTDIEAWLEKRERDSAQPAA